MMEIGDQFVSDLSYYRRVGVRKYLLETGLPVPAEGARGPRRPRDPPAPELGLPDEPLDQLIAQEDSPGHHGGVQRRRVHGAVAGPHAPGADQAAASQLGRRRRRTGCLQLDAVPWRFNTDSSRRIALQLLPSWGGLWNGTQKTVRRDARPPAVVPLQREARACSGQPRRCDMPQRRTSSTTITDAADELLVHHEHVPRLAAPVPTTTCSSSTRTSGST